jgi:spermidine synthase
MPREQDRPSPRRDRVLAALFVASGFSALVYQVVLSRYLQLVLGSTAQAVSAILVAFMLGMSLGSALGGRLADRSRWPLRLYAGAEIAIGVYCLAFPLLYPAFRELYLELAPPLGATAARHAVRFTLGVAAFLIPAAFMGVTTPAFARAIVAGRADSGPYLARLYGWNTLGASLGAMLTAYALVPVLGLVGSLLFGSLVNFAVALVALRLARREREADVSEPTPGSGPAAPLAAALVVAAFSTGVLSFGLEVIWTHLLAVLIGNSVYAFGLMLGALLLGLAIGTVFARRLSRSDDRATAWIGRALALAGIAVVGTLPVWDRIPYLFLLLARSSPSFALLEGTRFAISLGLMLLPTVCFGISFPLILRRAAPAGSAFGAHVGTIYAVNTAGSVAGALAGAYLLLPYLGSLLSLKVLGASLIGLGGWLSVGLPDVRRGRIVATAAAVLALAAILIPVRWDFNALNMAAAMYLGSSATPEGQILYSAEDPTGGLTSVVERRGVRTLLTNGKFQGDDSEEVPIQHRLANIPTLFTPGRERALVVGLGTGVTLASVAAHGFRETVCAEISAPIVTAARTYFAAVNGRVLDSASVRLVPEDGRSVLLERPERYDVISVEVTTIWFAGAGALYSREFYDLARRRLRRQGVLLQWFPVHHLSARNLYVVINTVRSVFPHVSVWTHRHQGFVIASNEPLQLDLASVRADRERSEMRHYLRELRSGSPLELLSDVVVTDRQVDGFLDSMARLLHADRSVVSTDSWPTLEYETPKDILSDFSYFQNRATFQRFRSPNHFPFRGTPSEGERLLASAAFSLGWGDPRALPRLAEAAALPDLSGSSAEWLVEELTRDDVTGGGFDVDPVEDLARSQETLRALVAGVAEGSECVPAPAFVAGARVVRMSLSSVSGVDAGQLAPGAVLDGVIAPEWSEGWRVRPDAAPPRLELRLDRPRRLASIHIAIRPVDGDLVRTRVLGLDATGRWRPIATGGQLDDVRCREARVYHLSPSIPPLVALRVELRGEALSDRIAVHEVWALERTGGV